MNEDLEFLIDGAHPGWRDHGGLLELGTIDLSRKWVCGCGRIISITMSDVWTHALRQTQPKLEVNISILIYGVSRLFALNWICPFCNYNCRTTMCGSVRCCGNQVLSCNACNKPNLLTKPKNDS